MIDLLLKLLARKRASVFPKMLNFSFKVKVMWKVVLFYWKKKSHFSALAQYFFKVFLNEYLINRSLLATIIIALAVNVAKAVKVPIILVVFGCVCVCVHVLLRSQQCNNQCGETLGLFWASLRGLSRLICNWACHSNRKKNEWSLNSCLYKHLNPFPHTDLIHLYEAWIPAV